MQCENCDQPRAQPIVIEVGRDSYFKPVIRRRVLCLPCVKSVLVQYRPDEAAELCSFIETFQFGKEENEMASYKEIQQLMAEITADCLVNLPKGKKLGSEQAGEATYRFTQLRLMASIAQSLDSIAYSLNKQAASTAESTGALKHLEGHYKKMVTLQERRSNGAQAPPTTAQAPRQGGN